MDDSPAHEEPAGDGPSPAIQAWMNTLTVEHEYDPDTGFILARELIGLPSIISDGPPVPEAIAQGDEQGRLVVVFATADRCAPCQQYKKSALNDARVVAVLSSPEILSTHLEVDQEPEVATAYLGGRGIPMTYAFRSGQQTGVLRGQRSAEELLAWLDAMGND